jgi:hypothetical protein
MSWFETPDDHCAYCETLFCDDGKPLGGVIRFWEETPGSHRLMRRRMGKCFSAATARLEDERATPGVDPHLLRPITIPILMAMKS